MKPRIGALLIVSAGLIAIFGIWSTVKADFTFSFDTQLIAYWSFDMSGVNPVPDDAQSDTINDVGDLEDGAVYQGGTDLPPVSGNVDALDVTANGNSRLEVDNSTELNPADSITVAAWIKPAVFPQNNFARIVFKGNDDSPFYVQYLLVFDGLGQSARFLIGSGGSPAAFSVVGDTILSDTSRWYHVAGTYDSATGEAKIYVDGVLDEHVLGATGQTINSPQVGADQIGIGRAANTNAHPEWSFNGLIDDVRIYDVALTDDEIKELASPQTDTDGDGVPDDQDVCAGGDDNVDTDGDNVPDFCDPCPIDANNDSDGDDSCDSVDLCIGDDATGDADGDGICDSDDVCLLGDDRLDTDVDGTADACDACPADPENDADSDGICESDDNCPLMANANQLDTDGDGVGDVCDPDDDNDGVGDASDNCPLVANADQANTDGDSFGDVCDSDDDDDGVADGDDNCPLVANADQANADGDASGDVCDPDDDNDGVADGADNCPLAPNPDQLDIDGDGLGDSACDDFVDPVGGTGILIDLTDEVDLPNNLENSLAPLLDSVLNKLTDGNSNNDGAACSKLEAFINKVSSQIGKKIDPSDAAILITQAETTIELLCPGG